MDCLFKKKVFRCLKCFRAVFKGWFCKGKQIRGDVYASVLNFSSAVLIKRLTRCIVVTLEFALRKVFIFNLSELKGVRFNLFWALLEIQLSDPESNNNFTFTWYNLIY